MTKCSALILLVPLCLTGCAGRDALKKFSQREIDRPYTLPYGTASWQTQLNVELFENPATTSVIPMADPFIWQSPLSNDFTLVFFPLPLGIKYQVNRDENGYIGLSLYSGITFSSDEGFRLKPSLNWSRRDILSREIALQSDLSFNPIVGFGSQQPFYWSAIFWFGPLWQITDTIAILPRAAVSLHQNDIPGSEFVDRESPVRPGVQTRFAIPLGLKAFWNFDPQWSLDGAYSLYRLGEVDGFSAHLFAIEFAHYW
jgi:hypothetical protein